MPALLALVLVAALALTPRADARAHVYWTTSGGEFGGEIGRANLTAPVSTRPS